MRAENMDDNELFSAFGLEVQVELWHELKGARPSKVNCSAEGVSIGFQY